MARRSGPSVHRSQSRGHHESTAAAALPTLSGDGDRATPRDASNYSLVRGRELSHPPHWALLLSLISAHPNRWVRWFSLPANGIWLARSEPLVLAPHRSTQFAHVWCVQSVPYRRSIDCPKIVYKPLTCGFAECPRQDSNLRSRLRRAMLYPLSYGGPGRQKG
jgi:hypothetical protein